MICISWPIREQYSNEGWSYETTCWSSLHVRFLTIYTTSTCPIDSYLGSKKSWDFLSSWLPILLHSDDEKWSKKRAENGDFTRRELVRKPLFSLHVVSGHSNSWIFMRAPARQAAVGVVDTPTAKQGNTRYAWPWIKTFSIKKRHPDLGVDHEKSTLY